MNLACFVTIIGRKTEILYDFRWSKEGKTSNLPDSRIKRKIRNWKGEIETTEGTDNKSGLIPKWVKTAILGGTISGIAFFGISKLLKKVKDNDDWNLDSCPVNIQFRINMEKSKMH